MIRAEEPADIDTIRGVVAQAFATVENSSPPEPHLIDVLRGGEAWIPDLSLVATVDDRVVAHALLSRVTVGAEHQPALVLGPVGVLPAQQGIGVGTTLIRAGLDSARNRVEKLVVVFGSPAYYRRFGFVPAVRYGLTSAWSDAGDPWQALSLDGNPAATGQVAFPHIWHEL